MSVTQEDLVECPRCGHRHSKPVETCAACGSTMSVSSSPPAGDAEWSLAGDSLKKRWVVSVMAFWVSAIVLVVVSFTEGELNLLLVSICLGLLFLGVWLKARYRLHQRKGPGGH